MAGGSLDATALGIDPSVLDPVAALTTRTVTGGAADAPLDAMFDQCRRAVSGTQGWIAERRAAIAAAETELVALARMS